MAFYRTRSFGMHYHWHITGRYRIQHATQPLGKDHSQHANCPGRGRRLSLRPRCATIRFQRVATAISFIFLFLITLAATFVLMISAGSTGGWYITSLFGILYSS